MRALGIDLGRRRVGLAISDVSGTLARPLDTLFVGGSENQNDAVAKVSAAIARLALEDEGLAVVVVGMPARLDGSASDETRRTAAFIAALKRRTTIPIVEEDERLTSREAESLLAVRERDWRKRKARLDAAAAAVILQDYLDKRHA